MAQAVAKDRFSEVITNDIDPTTPTPNHHDLRKRWLWESVAPDWCVTNPPFSMAGECWNLAMDHSRKGVALLVRLSFLEVCKGRERIAMCRPTGMIVLPRIRFRGKRTDNVTCAWILWAQPGTDLPSFIECVGKLAEREAA